MELFFHPLVLLIVLLLILPPLWTWGRDYLRKRRLSRAGMHEIDAMTGEEFEQYLESLFQRLGYEAKQTRASRDFGADLVISKEGQKTVVQAKRSSDTIGLLAVQQVVAAKAYYKANATMVVTNNYYTKPAQTLARVNEVELWDREALLQALEAAKQRERVPTPSPADPVLPIAPSAPTTEPPVAMPAPLPNWLDGADILPDESLTEADPPRPASLKGKGQRL